MPEIEQQLAARLTDLPNKLPVPPADDKDQRPPEIRRKEHLDKQFAAWAKAETARSVHWTVLRPQEAKTNMPLLTVLPDNSVLSTSDITKSDTYTLTFKSPPGGITPKASR